MHGAHGIAHVGWHPLVASAAGLLLCLTSIGCARMMWFPGAGIQRLPGLSQ